MVSSGKTSIFLLVTLGIFLMTLAFFIIDKYQYLASAIPSNDITYNMAAVSTSNQLPTPSPAQKLANPPAIIKAVYVTGWSAGSKNYLAYLDSLIDATQINAVVIDIKDNLGSVTYRTGAPKAKSYKAFWPQIPDIDALVTKLHSRGIYVIGRIAVFQDPILAKNRPDLAVYDTTKTIDPTHPIVWQDNHGLSWMDPAAKEVWDYNIEIAKDAAAHGFDELNFDYIRFPTDGQNTMGFPKWDQKTPRAAVIKSFFGALRQALPGMTISADLFGQTTTNTDDMGIGQILENTFGYFDYVYPMVYPSHYISGFMKFKNPADHPYEIVKNSLASALARQTVYEKIQAAKIAATPLPSNSLDHQSQVKVATKIRPWLQDFNLGAIYDTGMVSKEIQGTTDATGNNFYGFLLWNPSNIYTQDAIAKPADTAPTPTISVTPK